MSPDLIARIRRALRGYAAYLRADGLRTNAADADALLSALPPDPGGEMPEPAPFQVVVDRWGAILPVDRVMPPDDSRLADGARSVQIGGYQEWWSPDNIREIRTPDGRVIWRAKED